MPTTKRRIEWLSPIRVHPRQSAVALADDYSHNPIRLQRVCEKKCAAMDA
jgi:hypothetical protein